MRTECEQGDVLSGQWSLRKLALNEIREMQQQVGLLEKTSGMGWFYARKQKLKESIQIFEACVLAD